MTASVSNQADESCLIMPECNDEQLLPGMSNDITFDYIVGKLSWRDFYSLAFVSRAWCHAIRSRQVYDARVRLHSAEALVLIHHKRLFVKNCRGIALYSMGESAFYELPPIPNVTGGFPDSCECVALEGKVYVLGGWVDSEPFSDESEWPCDPYRAHFSDNKVYVLDLAGQGQWKRCANMNQPRATFGCGVLDGKIYVFGGLLDFGPAYGSEVYDPIANTWSSIRPMPSLRSGHRVATVGAELVVHEGLVFEGSRSLQEGFLASKGDFWEVYHPALDEWRVVESYWGRRETHFSVQGKLYAVCGRDIHVHDVDRKSLTHLHSLSCVGPIDRVIVGSAFPVYCVVAVDDELLAVAEWYHIDEEEGAKFVVRSRGLIRSRGLGSENKEMVWRRVPFSHGSEDRPPNDTIYSMYPIRA